MLLTWRWPRDNSVPCMRLDRLDRLDGRAQTPLVSTRPKAFPKKERHLDDASIVARHDMALAA